MTAENPSREEIEDAAGTKDEQGVVQPTLDEIVDPDPEDASEADIAEMEEGGDEPDEDA